MWLYAKRQIAALSHVYANPGPPLLEFSYCRYTAESAMCLQIYGSVTMNNSLCLGIFLLIIYSRHLEWVYSSEVTVVVGETSLACSTYPQTALYSPAPACPAQHASNQTIHGASPLKEYQHLRSKIRKDMFGCHALHVVAIMAAMALAPVMQLVSSAFGKQGKPRKMMAFEAENHDDLFDESALIFSLADGVSLSPTDLNGRCSIHCS